MYNQLNMLYRQLYYYIPYNTTCILVHKRESGYKLYKLTVIV